MHRCPPLPTPHFLLPHGTLPRMRESRITHGALAGPLAGVLAFLAGWVTLVVELAAGRLLGQHFGVTNIVWATVIGLILLYLSAGYTWGGRLADAHPTPGPLGRVLVVAGLALLVVPVVARPLLRWADAAFATWSVGVLAAAFLAVLALFALPVTLLGMVSPYLIRLALHDPDRAGQVSGRVYAASTWGSVLGSFSAVLVLIPLVGTARTFALAGLVAGALGLPLLPHRGERTLAAVGLLGLTAWVWWWAGRGPIKATPGLIYEDESAYNYIQVVETPDGWRWLLLNEGQGVQSVYHPQQVALGGTWVHFHAAPFVREGATPAQVRRVAIVGLAGGTAARQAVAFFPGVQVDGWEVDPAVLAVGRRYFGLDAVPGLHAYVDDGRRGLRFTAARYDLIILDAYRPPYIPPHLTTVEFFALVRQRLTPTGVVALNVGRTPDDRRLVDAFAATLRQVFPTVYGMEVPNAWNTILYAAAQPLPDPQTALQANAAALEAAGAHPWLVQAVRNAAAYPARFGPGPVFTDDRAPVDLLTDAIAVRYLLAPQPVP